MNRRSSIDYILLCLLVCIYAGMHPRPATAQDFVVTHSQPGNGEHSVQDTAVVSFFFSKSLPFDTDFIAGFSFVEPRGMLSVRDVLLDLDNGSPQRPRIVRFTVAHRSRTDYAWVIYGIACNDRNVATNTNPVCRRDEYLDVPFVLNYSTTENSGTLTAQGVIETGSSPLVESEELHHQVAVASFGRVDPAEMQPETGAGKVSNSHPILPETALAASDEMKRTVILMLSGYSTSEHTWRVRSSAAVASDGSFTFSTLRAEKLYPIAIRFKKNDNQTIEAFGIHDPDDRGVATAVDLTNGESPSLSMRMYPFASSNSSSAIERAGRAAGDEAWTRLRIQDLSTIRVDPETGVASAWTVGYLDEQDQYLALSLDPLAARFTIPSLPPPRIDRFDAGLLMDSQAIMSIAEQSGGSAFRNENPGTTVRMRLAGSNEIVRPDRELFWTVTYTAPTGDHRTFHLDPFDGSMLGLVDTHSGSEMISRFKGILAIYPNPASNQANISFSIDPAQRARLQVFDVLGRQVYSEEMESHANEHSIRTENLPSGAYIVRLNQGDRTWQSMITVLR
jgi:hypothetical protein